MNRETTENLIMSTALHTPIPILTLRYLNEVETNLSNSPLKQIKTDIFLYIDTKENVQKPLPENF